MAATPDGGGYWLVGADGGVLAYGDAKYFGGTGALRLYAPIVDIAATPDGGGYWLVSLDGGVFPFGDAKYYGSTGKTRLPAPIVGFAPTPDGKGYWLAGSHGEVYAFGDAGYYGSLGVDEFAQHPDCGHRIVLRRPGLLARAGRGRSHPLRRRARGLARCHGATRR